MNDMENRKYHIDFLTSTDSQLLDSYSSTVTGVVKNVAPAVVHIRVIKKVQDPRAYIVGKLILNGKVKRAQLGVAAHPVMLTQRMIEVNQLKTKTGVYVYEISSRSEISNKELKEGDIIVEFDGNPVSTVDNLHKYLNETVIGKMVTLAILRGGRKNIINVIPGELK